MFLKAEDIALPEGTEFTGYAVADTPLDAAKFTDATTPGTAPTPAKDTKHKKVSLTVVTDQKDGDVYIDSAYRAEASTPIQLSRGIHLVAVRKDDFRDWYQRVVIDGDQLKLSITLQPKH